MPTVTVTGTAKLRELALRLRLMNADRTIVNNLTKRLRRLAQPVVKEIRASAIRTLPRRGGLGAWVAESRITTSVKRSERKAGVYITVAKGQHDIRNMDAGRIRHPLFGDRKHWYPETVQPGFGTVVRDGPVAAAFRDAMSDAVDEATAQVVRGL